MECEVLKNKPLVEAIFEMRWTLPQGAMGPTPDPTFRLIPGILFQKIKDTYPEYQMLNEANLPDEVMLGNPQHRFRAKANGWPLVQIGQGIATVNDTDSYVWLQFRKHAIDFLNAIDEVYLTQRNYKPKSFLLRYIDAVEFDPNHSNVFEFLREKMGVSISLPKGLIDDGLIDSCPRQMSWQTTFVCKKPQGLCTLAFGLGTKNGKPALVWETVIQSSGAAESLNVADFPVWIDEAHVISHDWFFKLIDGPLVKEFSML